MKSLVYTMAAALLLGGSAPARAQETQDLPKGAVARIGRETSEFLDRVLSVDVSADGGMAIFGREDGSVDLWNLKELKLLRGLLVREGPRGVGERRAESVRLLPDGKHTLVAGNGIGIRLLELKTGAKVWTIGGRAPAALSPDGRTFAAPDSREDEIVIRETMTGKEVSRLKGHKQWINSLSFAPNGKSLASGSSDGTVRKWDLASGREVWRLGEESTERAIGPSFPHRVRVSPTSKWLAVTEHGCWQLTLSLVDYESGAAGGSTGVESSDAVQFLPGSDLLAFHGEGERIFLWDANLQKVKSRSLGIHKSRLFGMAATSDGSRLITAGEDGRILVWDVSQFEPMEEKK